MAGSAVLQEFGLDIWTADGSEVVAALGFHYPTRMAVIRVSGGDLFVWSPIALTDSLRDEVEAIGKVRFLIAPNSLHHLFIADWKHAFPDAQIFAAPGLREKRQDLAFDGDLDDAARPPWSAEIDHVLVAGNAITDEVVFFHRKSGVVIFTDLVQQMPVGWFSGWRAAVAKLDLMVGPEPSVPRKFRVSFTNRALAREAVKHILAWPAEKGLMAHGTPVEKDSQAFLRRAFQWLVK